MKKSTIKNIIVIEESMMMTTTITEEEEEEEKDSLVTYSTLINFATECRFRIVTFFCY